jgi:dihydroorotate dehydrogenase electron transfer subunit
MNLSPKEVKAKILLHRRISADYFRLRLLCPEIARLAHPGQFVMVRVNELKDPFLRRPFSFSQIFPPREKRKKPMDEGGVEICYQIVGRGTSLMSQLVEGQRIDLLGPLGKGFWTEEGRSRAILVGGGIGVAPLLSWAQELRGIRHRKKKPAKNPEETAEVLFLVGGKSKEKILGIPECRKMGLEPLVATDDGSLGIKGPATDLLERELLLGRYDSTVLYACGPMPMLVRVAQMAYQFTVPCQVLLESRMACGVGACLGCTVKVREEASPRADRREGSSSPPEEAPAEVEGECGMETRKEGRVPVISEAPPFRYARACKEGPVFDTRKIFWE